MRRRSKLRQPPSQLSFHELWCNNKAKFKVLVRRKYERWRRLVVCWQASYSWASLHSVASIVRGCQIMGEVYVRLQSKSRQSIEAKKGLR